jgi:hypothetical protein
LLQQQLVTETALFLIAGVAVWSPGANIPLLQRAQRMNEPACLDP